MNQSQACQRNVRLSSEFKSSAVKCEICPRLSAQESLPIVRRISLILNWKQISRKVNICLSRFFSLNCTTWPKKLRQEMHTTKTILQLCSSLFDYISFPCFYTKFRINNWLIASDKWLRQEVWLQILLCLLWVLKNVNYCKYFITFLKSFRFYPKCIVWHLSTPRRFSSKYKSLATNEFFRKCLTKTFFLLYRIIHLTEYKCKLINQLTSLFITYI